MTRTGRLCKIEATGESVMRRNFRGRKADGGAKIRGEDVAIAALTFIAEEPERLGRFLALSGLGPDSLRAAAGQPDFLAGVLDHLLGDEALLLAFAQHAEIKPDQVTRAHRALTGGQWERDLP
jgi:Protein of unknown function (DUF3572)